jgi:2-keto-3-deoxy-L-rhamnonate aldolase RhmA
MVCSADEAAAFVSACTYPPRGTRGFGPKRASRYGTISVKDYLETIDDSLVKIVQLEHRDAVENIDSILEVPGIDAVVVGPFDLSGSLGVLGQVMHPDMQAACRRIVERCKAHHIPIGPSLGMGNMEFLRFWLDQKPDYIFHGDDLGFVRMGVESNIAKIREMRV